MSSLATVDTASSGVEDDIPDDLFAELPSHAGAPVPPPAPPFMTIDPVEVDDSEEDIMTSLPTLPSLEGLTARLADVNNAIDAARAEADSLRNELARKAEMLRSMAAALDAI